MTQREVRLFGDPVLKTVSAEVTDIDAGIKTLVGDMLETMDAHNGVGLAANQVGVTRRVIVFDCTHETPRSPRAPHQSRLGADWGGEAA